MCWFFLHRLFCCFCVCLMWKNEGFSCGKNNISIENVEHENINHTVSTIEKRRASDYKRFCLVIVLVACQSVKHICRFIDAYMRDAALNLRFCVRYAKRVFWSFNRIYCQEAKKNGFWLYTTRTYVYSQSWLHILNAYKIFCLFRMFYRLYIVYTRVM